LGGGYGFEHALIAVVPQPGASLEQAFLRSNYSPEWRRVYDETRLVYVDPTVAHCIAHSTPLIWEPGLFSSEQQKAMYEEASSHGLRSGITLPFHGPNGELGILCFVNDAQPGRHFMKDLQRFIPELALLRDFAFEASLRFAVGDQEMHLPVLTRRELECLKWGAAGKSSWEIARILRCSESTVNFHFCNIRRKFDATSRQQAVVKAIKLGMI
jgi:LuxR family quorum-sensing transcriptional regulator LasR